MKPLLMAALIEEDIAGVKVSKEVNDNEDL